MSATAAMAWDAMPRARRRLAVALVLSLTAHVVAWHWARFPSMRLELPEAPLAVALVPRTTAPAPAAAPEALEPAVARPTPDPHKAAPSPRKLAQPRTLPAPSAPPPRQAEPAPHDPVLTARTEGARPPSDFTVPPPAPVKLADPVPAVAPPSPEALSGYGESISQLLGRYREYPRLALLRGWEGSTTLRLRVAPGGKLADTAIHQSSGHAVLDEQALVMVKRLSSLPTPPESLRDREFDVLVPVVFQLTK